MNKEILKVNVTWDTGSSYGTETRILNEKICKTGKNDDSLVNNFVKC